MLNWWRQTLIPREENNFRPHSLQKAALVGMLLLILISFSVANLQSILWLTSDWLVAAVLPAVVAEETNESREAENLPALTRNPLLDEAAKLKAENMARDNYFSHWSPSGVSPWHWFDEVGYQYVHAGENLAVHFTDSTAVVEAWLNSPTHRANILNSNYTEIGIGTAEGSYEGYDTVFVVQLFGTPATGDKPASSDVSMSGGEVMNETVAGSVAGVSEERVGVTDAGTMVLESFAATENTNSQPAISEPKAPSTFFKLATSPRLVLQIAYSLIGLFVIVALLIAIVLEWRRHHPIQLAYSAALLVFMIALFRLHLAVSGGIVIA